MSRCLLLLLAAVLLVPFAQAQVSLRHGGDEHWDPQFGENGLNDVVFATAAAPDGSVYVGGKFTLAGTMPVSRLARWDGETWHDVGGGVDDEVYALVVDPTSGDLYAGGFFQSAGGVPASHVARWDGQQWHPLGLGTSNSVNAIAVDPVSGDIYAGGRFQSAGGIDVNGVARWDGQNWHALGSGVLGSVYAILIDDSGRLIVGGAIDQAGDVLVENIARWDGKSWVGMGDPGLLEVRTISGQFNGTMLVGGLLDNPGDPSVVYWEESDKSWTGILSNIYAGEDCWFIVTDIEVSGSRIYVGSGDIVCYPEGEPHFANSLLEYQEGSWEMLGSGLNGLAYSLSTIGDDLYIGGYFSEAGLHPSYNFARWNDQIVLPSEPQGPAAADESFSVRVAPNPSRGHSLIHLTLGSPAYVTLQAYDVMGRRVGERSLGLLTAGPNSVPLSLVNVAAGTYLLRSTATTERDEQAVSLIVTLL